MKKLVMVAERTANRPSRTDAPRPWYTKPQILGPIALVLGAVLYAIRPVPNAPAKQIALTLPAPELSGEIAFDLPPFELRDQRGALVDKSAFEGRVTIVSFFFTQCPTVCPRLMAQVKALETRTRDLPLSFVSISVDPENDTPEALASYADNLGAPERWRFLTGDADVVTATVRDGFKTVLTKEESAGDIIHGEKLVVIDKRGRIRGFFDASGPEADLLVLRAKELLEE